MATSKSGTGIARIKDLHVSTAQGFAGLLSKNGQHVFSYAPEAVASEEPERSISLTMPVRAESYKTTPMLPVFQTFLPEGFLAGRIVEKFSKTLRIDEMALLALSGANAIGRVRVSQSPGKEPGSGGFESLKEILGTTASKELFEDLCDRYLIASGIAGVQPKVMLEAHDDLDQRPKSHHAGSSPGSKASIGARSTLRGRSLIVKASSGDYPHLVENEFHCLSIARSVGLPVPDFWLSDETKLMAVPPA